MKDVIEMLIFCLTMVALAFVVALPAKAEQCETRANVERNLAQNFSERIVNAGVSRGGLIRVYVNRETGTWTITMLRGPDHECLISSGEGWQELDQTAGNPA